MPSNARIRQPRTCFLCNIAQGENIHILRDMYNCGIRIYEPAIIISIFKITNTFSEDIWMKQVFFHMKMATLK